MTSVLPLVQSRIKYAGVHFEWMVLYEETSQNAFTKITFGNDAVDASLIDCGTCLHCASQW